MAWEASMITSTPQAPLLKYEIEEKEEVKEFYILLYSRMRRKQSRNVHVREYNFNDLFIKKV